MTAMQAFRLSGVSSRRTPVSLKVVGEQLAVFTDGEELRYRINELRFSDRLGSAARLVYLPDGSHIEVTDHDGLDRLLPGKAGPGLVHRMEAAWTLTLAAFAGTAMLVAAFYFWGLPWAAARTAMLVPESWNRQLGSSTMQMLEHMAHNGTAVTESRQDDLRRQFAALTPPTRLRGEWTLHFMNFGSMANAFALPSGDIVVTDALVTKARSDGEIMAVLAHELGHVAMRHSLRAVLQSAGVSAIVSTLTGDFSHLATLSAGLVNLSYSRDMEREADDYSLRMLRANNMPPGLMADALETLRDVNSQANATRTRGNVPAILSSHPDIDERIARARQE